MKKTLAALGLALLAGCGGGGGSRGGTDVNTGQLGVPSPRAPHLTVEGQPNHEVYVAWEVVSGATSYTVLRRVGGNPAQAIGNFSCSPVTNTTTCHPRFLDATLAAAGAVTGTNLGYAIQAFNGAAIVQQTPERAVTLGTTWQPMLRGSPAGRGFTTETIAVPPTLAWQVNLTGAVLGVPAADTATRTLYLGTAGLTSGTIAAYSLDGPIQTLVDGELQQTFEPRWSKSLGGPVVSSPTLADGVVFAGGRDNNLYALDALTGQQKWVFFAQDDVGTSPVVAYGRLYAGAGNPINETTAADTTIYCLDAFPDDNGDGLLDGNDIDEGIDDPAGVPYDLIWKVTTGGGVGGSAAVRNGLVYVGSTDDKLYLLDAFTGASRTIAMGAAVVATPAVQRRAEGMGIYVGTRNKFSAFADQGPGSTPVLLWEATNLQGDVLGGAAVTAGTVLFNVASLTTPSANKLYAVDIAQGQTRWSVDSPDQLQVPTNVLVAGDKVFMATGNPLGQDPNAKILALSLTSGTVLWQEQVGSAVSSPMVAGGLLIFGTANGGLRAYRSP